MAENVWCVVGGGIYGVELIEVVSDSSTLMNDIFWLYTQTLEDLGYHTPFAGSSCQHTQCCPYL